MDRSTTDPLATGPGADWLAELESDPSVEAVRAALAVPSTDIPPDDAARAMAAAEVVASAFGAGRDDLPEEVVQWAARAEIGPLLARLAYDALERIAADSDLERLGLEPDEDRWQRAVADLQRRLASATADDPTLRPE